MAPNWYELGNLILKGDAAESQDEAEALRLLKIDPSAMLDPNAVYPVPPEAPPAFVVRQ